jgi:PIN domain nuclease of toxin-antitoxin system
MQYLLDTNVLLWFLEDNERLPPVFKTKIEEPGNEIFVSIVSLWEITIKVTLQKLALDTNLDGILADLQTQQILILPVQPNHLKQLLMLPLHHRDPFDRLLVAQCQSEGIEMLFTDSQVAAYFPTRDTL